MPSLANLGWITTVFSAW